MTLGSLLASKRKLANLTQQQVGETLNVSPQAVSKWENDLAQPDLVSLKRLAELYNVPVSQLIDAADEAETSTEETKPDPSPVSQPIVETKSEPEKGPEQEKAAEPAPKVIVRTALGVCEDCNRVIYEAKDLIRIPDGMNGKRIICPSCNKKRKLTNAYSELEEAKKARTRAIGWGITVGILVALITFLAIKSGGIGRGIVLSALSGVCSFCLMGCLIIEESFVGEMWINIVSVSFHAPSIIFTFDLDGCAFLIGMKLLFWAIGLALSIGAFFLATGLGFLFAPFAVFYDYSKNKETILKCENEIRANRPEK